MRSVFNNLPKERIEQIRKEAAIRTKKLMTGRKLTEEQKRKRAERYKGEKSHFWKGGVTNKNKIIRASVDYKLWRDAVFKRDNWTCKECGERSRVGKSVELHSHHIKSFAEYPKLRFEIDNGITLCIDCHKKTDTYLKNKLIHRR